MILHGPIEALDAVFRDQGVALAVDVGDARVAQGHRPVHQQVDAVQVVGDDAGTALKQVVDGDAGDGAGRQLRHLIGIEIHAGQAHAVHVAVAAVLQVGHLHGADVVVDEGDVIALALGLGLEGVQHRREEGVHQAGDVVVHSPG